MPFGQRAPTKPYQTTYTIPVGENLAPGLEDFANTYVIAQSTQDGNTVTIDDPSTGGVDVNVVLNKGQVTQLYGIDSGTTVTGTYPVQVQFIAGEGPITGQASEFRGWTMVPTTLWDDPYYGPDQVQEPVPTRPISYIYNPPGASLTGDLARLIRHRKFHAARRGDPGLLGCHGCKSLCSPKQRRSADRYPQLLGDWRDGYRRLQFGMGLPIGPVFCTSHRVLFGVGTRYQCCSTS